MIVKHVENVTLSTIDTLKGSPGLLVLVLLQIATLVLIYFAVDANQERFHERELALINRCFR